MRAWNCCEASRRGTTLKDKVIYVDVDDTFVRSFGSKRISMSPLKNGVCKNFTPTKRGV